MRLIGLFRNYAAGNLRSRDALVEITLCDAPGIFISAASPFCFSKEQGHLWQQGFLKG